MKKLAVSITDELDERLREFVMMRYGGRRGTLSIVVEEAIRVHLKEVQDHRPLRPSARNMLDKLRE